MKKFLPALFCVLCFVSAIAAQKPTPTPDDDVVKISTSLIQIDVTVTDRAGKIVTDLKPEDFEIYENGEKQNVSSLSFVSNVKTTMLEPMQTRKPDKNAVPVPVPPRTIRPEQVRRTIALVVDDLTLSFESTHFVRRALRKFVDEQMQDGDLVAIIRTGGGVGALQQFSADRAQLRAAIDKVRWNPQGSGRIGAFAPIEATQLEQLKATGATVSDEQLEAERNRAQSNTDFQGSIFATGTLGALDFIVRGMQELPGRKSVLLLSDGFKISVKGETGFTENSRILDSLRRLTDLANRASVVVYTLDARGLQTLSLTAEDDASGQTTGQLEQKLSDRRNELFDTQEGLVFLARQTGGSSIINNNDLGGGIRRILDDQSYYLLGYEPDSETFDPKTRRYNKLQIKVNRPGVRVRYRSGFFGVSDEQIQKPAARTAQQQITSALTSPFGASGIALRLNTLFGNDAKDGSFVRSLIHVNAADLTFTDAPDGTKKAVFDIMAISFGDNGTVADQITQSYTMTVTGERYRKVVDDGFVYFFTFPVKKPGAYQLRVAVRDQKSEKVGSANQFIEVPNLKKNRLTVSGIVLENLTPEQWRKFQTGAPPETVAPAAEKSVAGGNDPLNATSLRRFGRGTILRYGAEIYNARLAAGGQPSVTVQLRMFRDGKLILDGKPVPLDPAGQTDLQRIKSGGALSIGKELPPGDYVLQIVANDAQAKEKQRIATQFVQFEIVE